jgi:hypothetical protein
MKTSAKVFGKLIFGWAGEIVFKSLVALFLLAVDDQNFDVIGLFVFNTFRLLSDVSALKL